MTDLRSFHTFLIATTTVALLAARPTPAHARPTTTFTGPSDFTLLHVSLTTKPHGGTRTSDLYVDFTNKRIRVDREARGGHPATAMFAFFDRNLVYVFSEGACQRFDSTAASMLLPTLGAALPASFWDPDGNLGVLTQAGKKRVPYWVESGGMLEPAGRKLVTVWRQTVPGGAIEFGLADGDPTQRPYYASWRSTGRGVKLRGGVFFAGAPDASAFTLPPECTG